MAAPATWPSASANRSSPRQTATACASATSPASNTACPENTDHHGWNALHWALRDLTYARGPFAAILERVSPFTLDMNVGERLARSHSEYRLFQTLWPLLRSRFNIRQRKPFAAFETADILDTWQHLPSCATSSPASSTPPSDSMDRRAPQGGAPRADGITEEIRMNLLSSV
ncbi:MAG: hypothetical protein JNK97_17060 [Zoogloea sp.]|nr:hypothetical protein [Zoogloea sp.]